MYHSLVHQSSIDGLWRDFQPLTVTNNSAMNNHVCDVISQISVDMSLLQNNQDNSAPKNEVIVEGHGKLPWLERTTWVQKLSPDVITSIQPLPPIHWSGVCSWSLQLSEAWHRDYLSQTGKPCVREKTNDQFRILPMLIGKLMHSWYLVFVCFCHWLFEWLKMWWLYVLFENMPQVAQWGVFCLFLK